MAAVPAVVCPLVPVLFAETVELHCEGGTMYANGAICAVVRSVHGLNVAITKAVRKPIQRSRDLVNIVRMVNPCPFNVR